MLARTGAPAASKIIAARQRHSYPPDGKSVASAQGCWYKAAAGLSLDRCAATNQSFGRGAAENSGFVDDKEADSGRPIWVWSSLTPSIEAGKAGHHTGWPPAVLAPRFRTMPSATCHGRAFPLQGGRHQKPAAHL